VSLLKLNKTTKSALIGYAFLLPGIISLILFMVGPILYSFVLSFFSFNIFSSPVFTDLDNYIRLLFDPHSHFWEFLYNTLFFLLSIPIGLILSLFLALLVNHKLRGITFFRTVYFIPVIASMITVALLWEFILDKDFGLLNSFLAWLGFSKVDWFGNSLAAKIGISLMLIWKSAGYNMLIYLAALQGIPEQYYEAMQIDGANRWQRFKNVTFPLLAPAHFFLLITSVIGTFQLFGPIYVMTKGGPVTGTWTLIYEVYWKAYQEFEMGYAAAVSWILFLLMLLITLVQWRFLGKRVHYA
jgi:multiple sugar transport system permease protein